MTSTISVIVATAREDRPWENREDLRTCDPAVLTLTEQVGAPPYEVIVTDALSRERSEPWTFDVGVVAEWMDQGARFDSPPDCDRPIEGPRRWKLITKHGANDWHRRGRSALGRQVNEAVAVSSGEIVVCLTEACMCPPWLLRRIAEEYEKGHWPNLLYLFDRTFVTRPGGKPLPAKVPKYDLLGHVGKTVVLEHRWRHVLGEGRPWKSRIPWSEHFGYFTMLRSTYDLIGGYDECMDGDRDTADMDIGSRLQMLGHDDKLYVARDLFVVEAVAKSRAWCSTIDRDAKPIKCNYALLLWNRLKKRILPSTISEGDIEEIETVVCGSMCPIRDECSSTTKRWPFDASADPELRKTWQNSVREPRFRGQKEGTK